MRRLTILLLVVLLALAAAACGDDEEEATTTAAAEETTTSAAAEETTTSAATGGEAILTVGDTGFTQADLEALGVETLTLQHPDGPRDFTGVRLSAVLTAAGIDTAATTLTLIAADGYESEVPLADALACADCLIAFDDDGTLRAAMSGMPSKAWVKELVEIVVG